MIFWYVSWRYKQMGHLNNIRGRGPYKIDTILNYFITRPGSIFSPKEVSDALGLNLQTTVTVLNRLALEGTLKKRGRGRYCYSPNDRFTERSINGIFTTLMDEEEIDHKMAELIYEDIFNMACEAMGPSIVEDKIGLHLYDFDEKEPFECLRTLVKKLIKVMGRELTADVVKIVLDDWDQSPDLSEILMGGRSG
jgi:hypothetical protein